MKIYTIILLIVFNFVGCDTYYIIHGRVVENNLSKSKIISIDKSQVDTSQAIKGALVSVLNLQTDSSLNGANPDYSIYSDEYGKFSYEKIIGAGEHYGSLIISKPGFTTDTMFYKYKGADTINVIIKLKRK